MEKKKGFLSRIFKAPLAEALTYKKEDSVPNEGTVVPENGAVTDAEVEARLADVKEKFEDAPKAEKSKDECSHENCNHKHHKSQKKAKKMRDIFPGYQGPKFTPSSPSPASLEQKRQKKARRLARLNRK